MTKNEYALRKIMNWVCQETLDNPESELAKKLSDYLYNDEEHRSYMRKTISMIKEIKDGEAYSDEIRRIHD